MTTLTAETINSWADDPNGPVALHMKQKLMPVEGEDAVIFPPTYADIGYNIDTLSDGTKVCTIDSVGSQANRMEPIFKNDPYSQLVPQIAIELHSANGYTERRSLLDLAHRSADAVVHSSPTLAPIIAEAFKALRQRNDAMPLCSIAPTSLVFGAWDSRGGSGEKRPRLIRSVIRAWNVDVLSGAAQFNSVWKFLTDEQKSELEKEAKAKKTKLSEKGFADAPATFRKVGASAAKSMPEFKHGAPNPERRVLGGIYVQNRDGTFGPGRIQREVTINLRALRQLKGASETETHDIHHYLLALALTAAVADLDLFLRSGCELQIPTADDEWNIVPRRGDPERVKLSSTEVSNVVLSYALNAVKPFKTRWPDVLIHKFELKEAKKLLAKKEEDDGADGA
jgi:CRISPR-associated protein Csb1